MNNFSMANLSWHRWKVGTYALKRIREIKGWSKESSIHISNQAVIAQKDYVCYLAQEWAGARK